MRIDVVTIFPDYLAPLDVSLIGRARAGGRLDIRVHDLRDWTEDVHRSVDDSPYGGGAGMVMTPEPWGRALDHLLADGADGSDGTDVDGAEDIRPRLIVPTPSGRPFTQADALRYAAEPWLVFACGRYEGIDGRVVEEYADRIPVEEVSIGDYVLAGGEAAALVIVEATTRLLPGVLGNPESLIEESHVDGLLEYPVYTKPSVWRGRAVPEELLSGNHQLVATWRRDAARARTAERRPDLLEGRCEEQT